MKVIVFSNSLKQEGETELVTRMFESGLEQFHLNKPRFTEDLYKDYIEAIPKEFHSKIIVHQYHSYFIKYKLGGIYIHRKKGLEKDYLHRLQMWWFRFRRPDIKVSCSFSKLSSLYEVKEEYNHVLLRPIFGSRSDENYHNAFPETGLMEALKKTNHNVYAFGGTNYDRIETVFKLGFNGFAIKGGLWRTEDPYAEFLRIKEKIAAISANKAQINN